ncbi:MAG TPA: aquaporin [Candidatus Hypogeohydataceae bacterium YC40]
MNKEGEFGRKKINQYTRMLTFPLAIVQSIGIIYLIRQEASSIGGLGDITAHATLGQWILMVAAITGGSMNPARTFGPAVASGFYEHHLIYWVGPVLGGMVAGLLYEKVFAEKKG